MLRLWIRSTKRVLKKAEKQGEATQGASNCFLVESSSLCFFHYGILRVLP